MKEIEDIAKNHAICDNLAEQSRLRLDECYRAVFPLLLSKLYPRGVKGNPNEFIYSSFANRLYVGNE